MNARFQGLGASALILALAATLAGPPSTAWGQNPTGAEPIPSLAYRKIFFALYEGETKDAIRGFESEGRGAIKGVNGRWIDSICYHCMTGESYYQMGVPAEALKHFRLALQQYLPYADFMHRVEWRPLRGSNRRVNITWGGPKNVVAYADIPGRMSMTLGGLQKVPGPQGPIISNARVVPIDVTEIVRCLAHSIRRYGELLGPTAADDPVLRDVLAVLAKKGVVPVNTWGEAWIDVLLGCAFRAQGKIGDAVPHLKRGLFVQGGEFYHPLTSVAMIELGLVAIGDSDFKGAAGWFEEATYPAAFYGDEYAGPLVIEEALHYGYIAFHLSNRKGVYPILEPVAAWARQRGDYKHLYASVMCSAAENLAALGQTAKAAQLLLDVRAWCNKKQMMLGRTGARWNHVTAITQYQQGHVAAGDDSMAAALKFMQSGGSLWMFHIGLVDDLYRSGKLKDRVACTLYERVLRDPLSADWMIQPLEALSVLVAPHELVFEHWFEANMARQEVERAIEITDIIRRHRFLVSTQFGGRSIALRWLLESPPEVLDQKAALMRRDIFLQYPEYEARNVQVKQVRAHLSAMPLVNDDPAIKKAQAEALASLAKLSLEQEALLRQIAVRREPAPLVFPPLASTKSLQQSLPDNQAALIFYASSRAVYGFMLSKTGYNAWRVIKPKDLANLVKRLLRDMGNYETNRAVPLPELADDAWKKTATQLAEEMFRTSGGVQRAQIGPNVQELVIVPDGLLWYLPFESLHVSVGGQEPKPLISLARIRYAPFASMVSVDPRARRRAANTAVVVGRLFPGAGRDGQARAAFDELSQAMPGTVALQNDLPGPSSVYSAFFDRLVVLDDVAPGDTPYTWTPVTTDKGVGATLDSWLPLPWGGPEQVLFPGFHTQAENALKERADGSEVFHSVCGLMASGARTVVLARWRTGGKSSYDQIREFTQEFPHSTASEAWQRSVFLAFDADLVPDQEPRVQVTGNEAAVKTNHPFFWAGMMMVDTGTVPPKDDANTAGQPAKAQRPPGG
ncbi:MAG: hypothetical protein HYS13_00460 [Planctomycetia bacterium]|nr:hypothetical protein [Planctomycetia bacterium]